MQKTIQIRVIKGRVPDSILEDLSTNPFWCFTHAKIQQPKLHSIAYKTWPGKTLSSIQNKSNRNMHNILHTALQLPQFPAKRREWHCSGKMLYW